MPTKRLRDIKEAFEWEHDYDKVLALVSLIHERCKELKLNFGSLSQSEKLALHIQWLDSEVSNGGFHQFFTNPTGDNWHEILHSLKTIGATNTVRIFERALSVFPNNAPSKDRSERWQELARAGDQARARLHALDQQYYMQKEDVFALAAQYLQDHITDLQ